jgi:hypothetical protein
MKSLILIAAFAVTQGAFAATWEAPNTQTSKEVGGIKFTEIHGNAKVPYTLTFYVNNVAFDSGDGVILHLVHDSQFGTSKTFDEKSHMLYLKPTKDSSNQVIGYKLNYRKYTRFEVLETPRLYDVKVGGQLFEAFSSLKNREAVSLDITLVNYKNHLEILSVVEHQKNEN